MELFRETEKTAYYVSSFGEVWSLRKSDRRWLKLKLIKHSNGYLCFACWQNGKMKYIYVHRAVWEAFRGPIPEGFEINHINCKRDDNRLSNLEIVSHLQNIRHPPTHQRMCEAALKRWSDPVQHQKLCEAAAKRFSDPAQREKQREGSRPRMRPVFDITTGITYESTREAARHTGLHSGAISACCRGRISQTGGHVFRFAS